MTVTPHQQSHVRRLRPSLLAMATALLATAAPQFAHAQAATTPTKAAAADSGTTEVIVQGYRKSVQSAVASKRKSDLIVDVIKADDMASFPDANLAESIQRIPGVSIQRDGGEGRNITVQGLGGDFVQTKINGIEAYSATTGSTLGVVAGINRNRTFDYSTLASELFNSVTVSKSQSAEMDEGSLGATVDLQTARPFDKPGFRAALSGQAAYYDINKSVSPRFAALVSNTWGNFGALFSVAYSTRKAVEDGYSDTSQSDYSDANNGFCAPSALATTPIPYVNVLSGTGNRPGNQCFSQNANPTIGSDPTAWAKINVPNVFLPRNPGLGRFTLAQKRLGMTSSIQWRPSEATHVTFDAVYTQYDQNRTDYALSNASLNRNVNGASTAFPLFDGRPDISIMDVDVQSTGQVDYMKLNNVDIKHIEEQSITTTKAHELALNVEHNFNDRLSGNVKFAHAGTAYQQPWDILMSYDGFNKNGYVWDSRADVRRPYINYGYDVTDPNQVTFTNAGTGLTPDIRIVQASVFENLTSLEGNLKYDLNSTFTLKGGVMLKKYAFKAEQQQRFFANNGPPSVCSSNATTTASEAAYSSSTACTSLSPAGPYSTFNFANFAANYPSLAPLSTVITGFGKQLGLPAGSVTGWVVPNVQAYIKALGLLCNCANAYGDFRINTLNALGNNRGVEENDDAAYVQLDFDTDVLGGHRLRGNAGLRYVQTDVTAGGYTLPTAYGTAENKYTDLLPSMNATLDITPDVLARFAYAKVMSRPPLADLSPGGSVNTTFSARTASLGNPNLKPYRGENYDLSFEWYPDKGSVLSAGFFYKKVETAIQQYSVLEPYSATGLSNALLTDGVTQPTDTFTVTTFLNTKGGHVEGMELNWDQPFTFLPSFWKNFGTQLNYTYVNSKTLYYLTTGATPTVTYAQYPNVSPNSVNATLYYDDGTFSTHLSVSYRDAYITALPFKAGVPDSNDSYATTNVDLSASYKLTTHLKLTFDGLNLTNQAADQYSGAIRKAQRVFSKTGRQFFAGASYIF